MLFENMWATKFVEAMRNANGQLVMSERVPRAVIDELIAEVAEPSNQPTLASRPERRRRPSQAKGEHRSDETPSRRTGQGSGAHRRRRGHRFRSCGWCPAPSAAEVRRTGQRQAQQEADAAAYQQQMAPMQAQQAAAATAAAAAPAGTPDLTAQLMQLAQLKDQGVFSEEEFQAAKAKLLSA